MRDYLRFDRDDVLDGEPAPWGVPGKRTLTQNMPVWRKADGRAPSMAPGEAFAHATAGPPGPVPHLADMERAFGETFGGVLAHVGASAERGLDELGARAAAHGETVAFRDAAPSKELVAHELTHVVQGRRGGGGVQCAREVSDPDDAAEREADALAPIAAAGGTVQVGATAAAGIHRSPAPPPGSLEAATQPRGVKLRDLFVSITIPAGLVLASVPHLWGLTDTDIVTRTATQVTATLTPTTLKISFNPALYADVEYPVENAMIWSVALTFATGAVTADVGQDDDGWGGGDASGDVAGPVAAALQAAIAGTPIAVPGYDPMRDPDPRKTLEDTIEKLASKPGKPGAAPAPALPTSHPHLGADFSLQQPVRIDAGSAALEIAAGVNIHLSIFGAGSGAAINAAKGAQAKVDAADLQSIVLATEAITIHAGGAPAVRLKRVRMNQGGAVEIVPGDVELLGTPAAFGTAESLGRVLLGLLVGRGDADMTPRIVDGLTRAKLEDALAKALHELIVTHPEVIPGVDLPRSLLGVEVRRTMRNTR